ncbi:MAG: hypothetical protein JWN88_2520 [Frankiales bacterium]|nr:hypothetical protein [Frankiales bacterium]
MRDGFVDVVVLATETPSSCLPDVPVEQICFTPSPSTTRGEARAVAELARQRGWDDVLVVVQNEQAFRAGIRLERCVDDGVRVTLVTVRAGPARSLARTGYEVLALPKAVLFERSC